MRTLQCSAVALSLDWTSKPRSRQLLVHLGRQRAAQHSGVQRVSATTSRAPHPQICRARRRQLEHLLHTTLHAC